MLRSLVGSEMCIRDSLRRPPRSCPGEGRGFREALQGAPLGAPLGQARALLETGGIGGGTGKGRGGTVQGQGRPGGHAGDHPCGSQASHQEPDPEPGPGHRHRVPRGLAGQPVIAQGPGFHVHGARATDPVSYTHLRAHETPEHLVCRLLLEKKKKKKKKKAVTATTCA